MGNGKKPNLVGIQEFGVAAYVKDLKAGKLDARATKGRFVGYDSESKGYRIYWPKKRSVTVERNVVFNPEDVDSSDEIAVIPGEAQSEGEINKVIQASPKTTKVVEEDEEVPEKEPSDHPSTQDNTVETSVK
jgi:hypothetical protein